MTPPFADPGRRTGRDRDRARHSSTATRISRTDGVPGDVHEKRGENREAVACYRRVQEIINRTGDDFDPEYTQRFVDRIAKLDPPQAS